MIDRYPPQFQIARFPHEFARHASAAVEGRGFSRADRGVQRAALAAVAPRCNAKCALGEVAHAGGIRIILSCLVARLEVVRFHGAARADVPDACGLLIAQKKHACFVVGVRPNLRRAALGRTAEGGCPHVFCGTACLHAGESARATLHTMSLKEVEQSL